MPKRGADEYITKENGSIASGAGEDTPRMSTAAQQARRKIAQPRGRRPQTPSSNSVANPFSQNPPPQQPTFGAVNGGVNFGASQSFPPSSTGNNDSFNFQPPQSSSFTFGAPANAPNPFANLNGSGPSEAQDISMESPQKKAAFGNVFGSNNFAFGQPAQEQSNPFGGFSGSQSTNTNGNNLFGQATATSAPSNPFAQSTPANPFGGLSQPSSAPQTQTSGFVFGQASGAATSTPASGVPAFGGFGATATTSTVSATTSAPFGNFGQTTSLPGQSALPTFGVPKANEAKGKVGNSVFGQSNTTTQPPSTGIIGSSTTPTSSGSNLFGAAPSQSSSGFALEPTSNQAAPVTNPFANIGISKSEKPKAATSAFGNFESTSQQTTDTVEGPPASKEHGSGAQATNPFAGVFGSASSTAQATPASKPTFSFGQPSEAPAPSAEKQEPTPARPAFAFGNTGQSTPKATAQESPSKPTKMPFTFGATSQSAARPADSSANASAGSTSSGFFGKPAAQPEASKSHASSEAIEETTAKSNNATPAPAFKFAAPPQSTSSGGLFSPAKFTTASSVPSGGLFSKLNSAVENSAKPQQSSGPLFKSVSSPSTGASEATAPAEVPKLSSASIFSGSSHQASQPASRAQTKSADLGESYAPASRGSAAESNISASGSATRAQPNAENTQDSTVSMPPVQRPVYTKGPTRVPGHVTAQQFQEYDRNYRLHALNHGLQQKLAALDPRSHDFDNVIRQYVAARENIGASVGLFVRNLAGSKRKSDQVDDREEEPEQKKRSREEPGPKSSSSGVSTSFGGSASAAASHAAERPSRTDLPSDDAPKSAFATAAGFTPSTTGFKPTTNSFPGFGSTSTSTPNPFATLTQDSHSASAAPSTTPTKSPPKKSGVEMPKFGGGANTNFFAAFGQQAKANSAKFGKSLQEKRKAEDFDSDEDDEEEYRKKAEEESRAKRAKIDSVAKGGFKPTFGSASVTKESKPAFSGFGSAGQPAFTGFASAASSNSFTSTPIGEDHSDADQDLVDDKDDDEIEVSGSSNGQAVYGFEEGDSDDVDEEHEDSLPEDEVIENGERTEDEDDEDEDDDNNFQTAMDRSRKNPNSGKSLFDRIEPAPKKDNSTPITRDDEEDSNDPGPIMQPAKNSSFPPTLWGSNIGRSTPEQPTYSPMTPILGASTASTGSTASTVKPAGTFHFTPYVPITTPTPAPGASIFSGGITRDGPVPGEGMFGSRPSTPSNVENNGSLAKSILTSPAGTDNTWKPGNSISFGNSDQPTSAPSFKFTAASPGEKDRTISGSLGALFGTSVAGSSGTNTPNVGFGFGGPAPGPAPGYLGAVSHLGGGSAASSAASSRATSPGLTDNESVATNDTEDSSDDPQTSLMESRPGEENETALWEGRSKVLKFINAESAKNKQKPNDWNSAGLGIIRVLKDKSTNRTRIVFRADPNANVLFNSNLIGSTPYVTVHGEGSKSGAVRGALMVDGKFTKLVFKLKTSEMANELAQILEENKNA